MPKKDKEGIFTTMVHRGKGAIEKEVVIAEFDNIEKEYGMIVPQAVVERAEDESNPMHKFFEWDDEKAGYNYRLFQARYLIDSVKVVIENTVIRKYHNIELSIDDEKKTGYVSLEVISKNNGMIDQLKAKAFREIQTWQDKYDSIEEFKGLVDKMKLQKIAKKIKE